MSHGTKGLFIEAPIEPDEGDENIILPKDIKECEALYRRYRKLNGWKEPWDRCAADYGLWQGILWIKEGRVKHDNHEAYLTVTMKRFVWEDRAFRAGLCAGTLDDAKHMLADECVVSDTCNNVLTAAINRLEGKRQLICIGIMMGKSLTEISIEIGVSCARVSQLVGSIRDQLRGFASESETC